MIMLLVKSTNAYKIKPFLDSLLEADIKSWFILACLVLAVMAVLHLWQKIGKKYGKVIKVILSIFLCLGLYSWWTNPTNTEEYVATVAGKIAYRLRQVWDALV